MATWILRLAFMVTVVNSQLPTSSCSENRTRSHGSPSACTTARWHDGHDASTRYRFWSGQRSISWRRAVEPSSRRDRAVGSSQEAFSDVAVSPIHDAQEQPPKIKPSQHGTVTQRINETTVTVVYNRPVARGRELFGKLVPFGRIWCPCADDATTVEVSTDVKVDGQELPAGKYSLWTEPNQERWTVMFNKNHAVWHTRYPEGQDALRLQITPRSGSHMETMAFYFPIVDGRKAELVLHWGTVVVPLPIEVP